MNDFMISCETTVDMSYAWAEARGIDLVNFHYYVDETEYDDDFFRSMNAKEFYDNMRNGSMTRTAQVNAEEYAALFRGALSQGKDVLHIALSAGLSGTMNSANIAADEMREEFPDRKIYVIDSTLATSSQGMLVDIASALREQGLSIDEVREEVEKRKLGIHTIFFTSDLTYLIRGGRVSKAAGIAGKILNICPFMMLARDGSIKVAEKIRGRKKATERLLQKMEELAIDGRDYVGRCYLVHADCQEDAEALRQQVYQRFPGLKTVEIYPIGPTIGSHTGPGTLAILFEGREKE